MVSKRIQNLPESGIRQMFALAKKIENPCNLSIGQPHYDVPENIREAMVDAIRGGKNGYTSTEGIPELREAIAKRYADKGVPQEDVFITAAVSGGTMLAIMALCDPGDELIIPDPYFIFWKVLPTSLGVTPVCCDTYPDFRWTREKLEAVITPKSKAILLSSPGNPTGVCPSEEELKMIAEVAKEHDLWVIYDEIYELYNFDAPHLDMSRYYPKTITLGGFSKNYAMTGWRVGSAAGPKEVIQQMLKVQQFTHICASSVAQWAAVEALNTPLPERTAYYKEMRDHAVEKLNGAYDVVPANGGFYLFIKAPEGFTGEEFAYRCLDEKLIVVPGNGLSEKNTHFRMSFATDKETLDRGIEILLRMARSIKPDNLFVPMQEIPCEA